jgi:hypothetical protein
MQTIDAQMILALATLVSSLSALVWSVRSKA